MPLDATDEEQLLGATAHGRSIFTFNVRDFLALARKHDRHAGIILAAQSSWSLPGLIAGLHRMLSETTASEWIGQVRWLNEWRS